MPRLELETNAEKLNMIMKSMNNSLCERLVRRVFQHTCDLDHDWELLGYLKQFPIMQLKTSLKYSKHYNNIDDMEQSKDLRKAAFDLQNTALGEFYFVELTDSMTTEQIIATVNNTMEKIVLGYYTSNEAKEVYSGSTDGVQELVNFYLILNQILFRLEQELRDIYYPEWKEQLYTPGYDKENCSNGHFLVHFIQQPGDAWNPKHFWSCNYISRISPNAFSSHKYGLLFNPRIEEIIGMAPTDLQTQMQCPDYVYDDIGNLLSFMFHEIHFDNKNLITYGHFSDMLSIYPMKDLARETCKNDKANYNEVLLSGSTYASGVFVFKRFFANLKNELFALCYSQRLPLIIYDDSKDTFECIPVRFIVCNVELNLDDSELLV